MRITRELATVAIAILMAVAIGSVLMLVAGKAPGHVWWEMIARSLSSAYTLDDIVYRATPIMLTGLAVSVALDAGLFNIGVEGELTAGVLACAVVGTALPAGTPAIVALPVCTLAAAAAGGFVGGVIGLLRVTRDAHEVITSIMLNDIVAAVALWIGNAVLFENGTTTGPPIIAGAELPHLTASGNPLNASLAIALTAVVAVWWLRSRTTWGQAFRSCLIFRGSFCPYQGLNNPAGRRPNARPAFPQTTSTRSSDSATKQPSPW